MTIELEQQATLAGVEGSRDALIEAKITKLKSRLETTRAHALSKGHWDEMIEDCEIILKHLQSGTQRRQ